MLSSPSSFLFCLELLCLYRPDLVVKCWKPLFPSPSSLLSLNLHYTVEMIWFLILNSIKIDMLDFEFCCLRVMIAKVCIWWTIFNNSRAPLGLRFGLHYFIIIKLKVHDNWVLFFFLIKNMRSKETGLLSDEDFIYCKDVESIVRHEKIHPNKT